MRGEKEGLSMKISGKKVVPSAPFVWQEKNAHVTEPLHFLRVDSTVESVSD